tara:strand:+ start:276 stop:3299 length:3024 start_codon:yes stop_codon:yes gene_type:complete
MDNWLIIQLNKKYLIICLILLSFSFSQTTGKISGSIFDSKTNNPIVGANIMLKGTSIGTASDLDGTFYIINLSPGKYTVQFSVIGYETKLVEDVRVSVNRTTPLNISLSQAAIQGATVYVKADQVSVKKDQTSTVKNISSDQIDVLPIENVAGIINMQSGVVDGHFRGGRSSEVTYLIDGMSVNEGFGGTSSSIEIEPETLNDLEIITGTFNAEYGRAMSGVVNQITKDGDNIFESKISTNQSNYITGNNHIFPGIEESNLNLNQDYKIQVSGPIIKDVLTFFTNYRYQDNLNHLNGYHYFNVSDSSNFYSDNSSLWHSEHTGSHIEESYCSDSSGIAVVDNNGNSINDSSECEQNYGICNLTYSSCVDLITGEILTNTVDELYCTQTLQGILSITQTQLERIHKNDCEINIPNEYEQNYGYLNPLLETNFNALVYRLRSEKDVLIPMNFSINKSLFLKLSFIPFSKYRFSFIFSENNDEWHSYDHSYKYNPYGMSYDSRKSNFYALQSNIMINNSSFIESKISAIENSYGNYVYENPLDQRYVGDQLHTAIPGFFTGGQNKGHTNRKTIDLNFKSDFNWQINSNHTFKTGVEFLGHEINNTYYQIRPHPDSTNYSPYVFENQLSTYSDVYTVEPFEGSVYIQDKMEFDDMVINVGLRYDYFDPNTYYPSNYRNPLNQISQVDTSQVLKAEIQTSLSPRFGLAYQIADQAVLHFSYGHFFQIPPMYAMYANSNWLIPTTNFQTILGNPNLEAEKTITYELGLWQKLNDFMGFEVNLYYRDIYNLLGTTTWTTYNQVKYGLYDNKDYGNVRGIELKYDANYGNLNAYLNYTLQYTKGIADSPTQAFSREGQSLDPINKLIPMSWDQRHTFNITVAYNQSDFGLSGTAYFNSGTPYTFEPLSESSLAQINLLPNNDYKPFNYNIDLTGYYAFNLGGYDSRITFSIYNLTDRLNQMWVNSKTGKAYTDILSSSQIEGYRSNFSTIEETYQNPAMYSAPRSVKIGLEIKIK